MRFLVAIAVVIALPISLVCAEEFWQKEVYKDWSKQEVEKILTDSPWARTVELQTASMSQHAGVLREAGGAPRAHSGDVTRTGGGRAVYAGDISSKDLQATPRAKIRLRWLSALPVRQAIARKMFGDEVAASARAAKMILAEQKQYVLGVTGVPESQVGADFERLKKSVTMKVKGKRRLAPIHVERVSGEEEIYVFFPKAEHGGPDLSVDDGFVEVELKLKTGRIRSRFDLGDMQYYGKLQI